MVIEAFSNISLGAVVSRTFTTFVQVELFPILSIAKNSTKVEVGVIPPSNGNKALLPNVTLLITSIESPSVSLGFPLSISVALKVSQSLTSSRWAS